MVKIAVLDDYQRVARSFADWSALEKGNEIVVFDAPSDPPSCPRKLSPQQYADPFCVRPQA